MDFDRVSLMPHPAHLPTAIGRIDVDVVWKNSAEWSFNYAVFEPPEALVLPPPSAPERTDGLWRTTCFELFLRKPGSAAYFEFNFSPSGRWAAYRFDDYRQGGRDLDVPVPLIMGPQARQRTLAWETRLTGMGIALEVAGQMAATMMDVDDGPVGSTNTYVLAEDGPALGEGPWLAAVSAVIEEPTGAISYWALAHPSDKPDFHHPDSFVLELP